MVADDTPVLDDNTKRINASPTKEFFIYMLTRDIPLTRAILDLVDNSVDGARRMRSDLNYDSLSIRVELDKDHFKIADNCGGIPVDIARNYAFRFGRAKDAPATPGSVGQFGVGMKRAFFKLGRHFTVQSATCTSRFDLDIDVESWIGAELDGKAGVIVNSCVRDYSRRILRSHGYATRSSSFGPSPSMKVSPSSTRGMSL